MNELKGRHAVVTGGGKGIGLAIACALKDAGANVTVISRSGSDAFFTASADVTDETALSIAFDKARQRFGAIGILVNNAGIAESAPLKRTDRAMWDRIIATNLTGTYLCSRMVLDEMLSAKWGRIVNIASIAGLFGAPYIAAYSASKHGVVGFTRSAAGELNGSGVTMNVVCPGYTETAMMDRALTNIMKRTGMTQAQAREELARTNPGGRIVTAEEVAQSTLSLIAGSENGREIVLPPLSVSS